MRLIAPALTCRPARRPETISRPVSGGFTLIELLVVIAIIAILAAMLIPVLSKAKIRGWAAHDLNATKQLTLGWIMYQGDNSDNLMTANAAIDQNLNYMDWTASGLNTNISGLVGSTALMSPYIKNPQVYKAAADRYRGPLTPGDRTRSFAIDGSLTGKPTFNNANGFNYFSAQKVGDLNRPGPANIWVAIDEHPDSIDDFLFMNDPGYAAGSERWRELPSSYHDGAGILSFADGHSEVHKWLVRSGVFSTIYPVHYMNYPQSNTSPWGSVNLGRNADYEWLESGQPFH